MAGPKHPGWDLYGTAIIPSKYAKALRDTMSNGPFYLATHLQALVWIFRLLFAGDEVHYPSYKKNWLGLTETGVGLLGAVLGLISQQHPAVKKILSRLIMALTAGSFVVTSFDEIYNFIQRSAYKDKIEIDDNVFLAVALCIFGLMASASLYVSHHHQPTIHDKSHALTKLCKCCGTSLCRKPVSALVYTIVKTAQTGYSLSVIATGAIDSTTRVIRGLRHDETFNLIDYSKDRGTLYLGSAIPAFMWAIFQMISGSSDKDQFILDVFANVGKALSIFFEIPERIPDPEYSANGWMSEIGWGAVMALCLINMCRMWCKSIRSSSLAEMEAPLLSLEEAASNSKALMPPVSGDNPTNGTEKAPDSDISLQICDSAPTSSKKP